MTIPWDLNGEAFLKEKMYDSPAFFTLSVEMDEMKPSEFIIYVSKAYDSEQFCGHMGIALKKLFRKTPMCAQLCFN